MLAGKVVDEFEVDGKEAVIRYPKMADAEELVEFWNSLVEEGAKINRQEKIDSEKEVDRLGEKLKDIEEGKAVQLVAEVNGGLVASGNVKKGRGTQVHRGYVGLMVKEGMRRKGLGNKLLGALLSEAKERLDIEIAWLAMFGDNEPAEKLYKKHDFKTVGKIEDGLKANGEYKNEVIMYKDLR